MVRVVEFRSRREFDSFSISIVADAYYTGTADRNYIVMPASGEGSSSIAAHEYAHFVMHANALRIPDWLGEGLAELFSTVVIKTQHCEIGGPVPSHLQTLRRQTWLPAAELLRLRKESPLRQTRSGAEIFYAESWAMTDMLVFSPVYGPRFADLLGLLRSGEVGSDEALAKVYGKPAEQIMADVKNWIAGNHSSRQILPPLTRETFTVQSESISDREARELLADLLYASGELNRAQRLYEDLGREFPNDPEVLASLGAVALRKGERRNAVEYWRRSLDSGLRDAVLCYRYALLAEEMALPVQETEHALERAIALQKNFDDARYKLALLKSNAGNFKDVVELLRAMAEPPKERAFPYWSTLSYGLAELGRREEAEDAARKALQAARSADERSRATSLAYVAKTDLAVRFARTADGSLHMETTRILHGTTDFNPFVEAADQLVKSEGMLSEVWCSEGKLTAFVVAIAGSPLTLTVSDPTHVQMKNAPVEFSCGLQPGNKVKVEYALQGSTKPGLLRGMEFQ